MEDFYRLYQDLPVPDLVKVARTPSDYLPEAVAAAEKILRERGVTREQISAEEWVIAQKEIADGLRKGRMREYTAWIGELFGGDRLTPGTDRWLTVLLVVYGCFYTYTMFVIIRQSVWFFRLANRDVVPGSFFAGNLIFAAYITVCLYCLLKQRWLGWSLVMVHVIYVLCKRVSILFHLFMHHNIFFELVVSHLLSSLIFIGLGILLWRPYVLTSFGIGEKIRSRTLLAAMLMGIAGMLF